MIGTQEMVVKLMVEIDISFSACIGVHPGIENDKERMTLQLNSTTKNKVINDLKVILLL